MDPMRFTCPFCNSQQTARLTVKRRPLYEHYLPEYGIPLNCRAIRAETRTAHINFIPIIPCVLSPIHSTLGVVSAPVVDVSCPVEDLDVGGLPEIRECITFPRGAMSAGVGEYNFIETCICILCGDKSEQMR
jgi:hypothetical protein